MNKTLLYILTGIGHILIYITWVYFTGNIGLVVVVAHWAVFGWQCCLSHVERWVHVKYVGESWKTDNWRSTVAYRLFKHIHPIFK